MGYLDELRKLREKEKKTQKIQTESYNEELRKIREESARALAEQTADKLQNMNKSTKFMNNTVDLIAGARTSGKGYTNPIASYIADRAVMAARQNSHNIVKSMADDVARSTADYNTRGLYNSSISDIDKTERKNTGNIYSKHKASNDFNSQFSNQEEYDNAFNMIKYGGMNYKQLMDMSQSDGISDSEKKWINDYASTVRTSRDVQDDINKLKGEISQDYRNVIESKSGIKEDNRLTSYKAPDRLTIFEVPKSDKPNSITAVSLLKEKNKGKEEQIASLEKEKEKLSKKEYYNSLKDKADFEEVAGRGASRTDNGVTHSNSPVSIGNTFNNPIDAFFKAQSGEEDGFYMTQDEKDIYSYLLEKEGIEAAKEYKKTIQEDINYEKARIESEGLGEGASGNVARIAAAIPAGLSRFKEGFEVLGNNIIGDEALPVSKDRYLSQINREKLNNAGPKVLGSSIGQMAYDALENTSNMAPAALFGMAGAGETLAGILGAGTLGINAGASSANETWREGTDKNDAIAYGFANGLLEGGLQYALGGISAFGGKLFGASKNMLKNKVSSAAGKALIDTGIGALGEGAEEYLQEIIDPVVRNITLGEDNKIRFFTQEALYSGLIGALTGGVMESGGNIINAKTDAAIQKVGKDLTKEQVTSLLDYAKTTDSESLNAAARDYIKEPTEVNAGKLKIEADAQIGEAVSDMVRVGDGDNIFYEQDAYIESIADEVRNEIKTIQSAEQESISRDNNLSRSIDSFSDSTKEAMNTALEGAMVDEITFKNAFANYYEYGKAGVSFDTAEKNAVFNSELTDSQKRLAYESGLNDRNTEIKTAKENLNNKTFTGKGQLRYINESEVKDSIAIPDKIRNLNERQKSAIKVLGSFAEVSGMNIALYQSKAVNGRITAPNGWYNKSNDTIYIDVNAGDVGENAILRTASHEITHSVKEWSPEQYAKLQEYVTGQFEADGTLDTMVEEEIRIAKSNGRTMTYSEAMDEVTANACEMMLKDTKSIERMAEQSPDLVTKIKAIINKIVDDIKRAFDGLKSGSIEHKRMSEILDDWTGIQKMWDDAVVDSAKNAKKAHKVEDSIQNEDIIFSVKDSKYAKYINNDIVDFVEEVKNGKINYNKKIVISESIPMRLAVDIKKYLDIDINFSECKNILSKNSIEHIERDHGNKGKSDHSMKDIDNIGLINYVIDNYTNIEKGKLSVENKNSDNTFADTIIMSMPYNDKYYYLVEAVPILKNKNELRIVSAYIGQKKETSQVANGKTFPVRTSESALESISNSKIAPTSNDVNKKFSLRDNTGKELSPEQAEYFKDSKVKDEAGNLKVVYHGTNSDFNTFSYDYIGKNGSAEGYGFYFTDSKEKAAGYSKDEKNIKELYLDIKKPLSSEDVTLKRSDIKKLIKEIDPTGDEIISNYESTGRGYPSKEWYNRGLEETIDILFNNGSDLDIISELGNASDVKDINETVYDILGYDGYIEKSKYEDGEVYVAFKSSQVKNIDNLNPTDNEDIRFSYRADTRSNREILADALMSAAKNNAERNNLESYKKTIGSLDMLEKYRREKAKQLKEAETAAERDRLETEINNIDKKIAYNDKRLLSLEATAPLQNVIKREAKANAENDIEYIKKRYAENRKRKQMTVLRNNIKNNSNSLISMIKKPTNQRHVPEEIKKPVTEFLSSIDFISAYADPNSWNTMQWSNKMNMLKNVLEVSQSTDETSSIEYDPDLIARMNNFVTKHNDKKLSDMDYATLEDLYIIVRSLRMSISNQNRMFMNKRSESAQKIGYQTIEEIKKHKNKKEHVRIIDSIDKLLNTDMLDSTAYFDMLGDNAKSIHKELTDGWNIRTRDIKEAVEYISELYKECGVSEKELKEWTGNKAKIHEFRIGDKNIQLTTGQIMSLYMHKDRKQSMEHITTGGIRPDIIKHNGKSINQVDTVKLTPVLIQRITSVLTEKQKMVAEGMQKYMSVNCAKKGNETSMFMYGYRKFNEKNYFPIKVNPNSHGNNNAGNNKEVSLRAIVNTGMTKNLTEKANNSILLQDIFDVYTNHVVDMANYHGLAAPVTDALNWYNYKYTTDGIESSVKKEIERAYGKQYQSYFINLIRDINGDSNRKISSDLIDIVIGNYKAAAVSANLRVVVQQPAAYIRAATVMDIKYLQKALLKKPSVNKAIENSPLAWWKAQGFFDTGIGQSMQSLILNQRTLKDKIVDKSLWLAGKADELTWGTLWNAVEYEVIDNNKGIDIESKEFINKVQERFEEIVYATQVVDSIHSKSQIMRSKDGKDKAITAFMAEPIKTYNNLRTAVVKKDTKKIGRVVSVLAVNSLITAALSAFPDAMRSLSYDDDKEKKFSERYFENFKKDSIDNLLVTNLIPYVREISSAISGTSSNRQETAWIESMVKSVNEIYKYINGNSKKKPIQIVKLTAKAISQAAGIPMYNALREAEAVYNEVRVSLLGMKSINDICKEAAESILAGDTQSYKALITDLREQGYSDSDINKMMDSARNKVKKGMAEKNKDTEDTDIKEANDTKEKSVYKFSDVSTVLMQGNIQDANDILNDLYETELKNTPDKYESFKNVRTKVKANLTKQYKALAPNERKAFGEQLKKLTVAKQFIYSDDNLKRIDKEIEKNDKK